MRIPRLFYFYLPAFLTECALIAVWLAEPIYALRVFHASPLALGILGTANGGGYALVALLVGYWSDHTGRRRWIILGIASQVVCILALPFCRTLWLFVLISALHTTLLGCFWAPFMSIFSETTPKGRLSSSLSRYNMSWCSGGIVGSLVSGALYDRVGPWAPFMFGAAIGGVVLAIMALCLPGRARPDRDYHPVTHPQAPLFMRQAWLVLVSNFFVVSLLMYIFPKFAETPPLAMSAEGISRLHGLRQGAMLATFALMGVTYRWHFRQYPIVICFVLMLLMMVLTGWLRTPLIFGLPFVAFGIATGIAYGLSAYYSMLSPVSKGSLLGMHEAFLSLGSMLGPIFGGVVIQLSGRPAMPFYVGVIPLLIFWLGVAWMHGSVGGRAGVSG